MESNLKVIVLGSGNSGSGAVYDYLALRPDFSAPLKQEFRLIQDPGGIMDLHAALVFGFHVNRANAALKNFIDLCKRCGKEKTKFQLGLSYNKNLNHFEKNVNDYIKAITAVEYKGMPFCESSKLTALQTFMYRKRLEWAKKRGSKIQYGEVYLPVTETTFLKETEQFLKNIFDIHKIGTQNNMNIAIDQGGTFWQPARSTRYYGKNSKTVVVTRDPRGVFSSFKTKGRAYPGQGVKLFCDWYREMMKHVDYSQWEDVNVLHLKFEDFVLDFDRQKKKLDDFLGISTEVESSVDIKQSAFNAKKFKGRLTDEELRIIKSELKDFLQF